MNEFFQKMMDTEDRTAEFDPADIQKNSGLCIATSLPFLFWLPFVTAQDSRFAKFYANQSILVLMLMVAVSVCGWVLGLLPLLGGLLSGLFSFAGAVLALLLIVFLISNAAAGKAKLLPLIGEFLTVFQ